MDELFMDEATAVRRRAAFAYSGFDGPHSTGSDFLSASYVYCRICGAMVPLGHADEARHEAAIKLHRDWHVAKDRPTYDPDEAVLLAMKLMRSTRPSEKVLAVIKDVERETLQVMNAGEVEDCEHCGSALQEGVCPWC